MDYDIRCKLESRLSQLKGERASWDADYRLLAEFFMPHSGRFQTSDRNRGGRRSKNLDSSIFRAPNILASGMLAGMTSPARPWVRLATADQDLNKNHNVKVWLAEATRLMLHIFSKSNTYRAFHTLYREDGVFGSSASVIQDDFENVLHHYPLTVGEFYLAQNFKGRVDTMYREFDNTVAQIVKEFGRENCSQRVQNLYDRGDLDVWVTICHAIEPREDRDTRKKDNKNMPFRSVYWEYGQTKEKVLRESGYKKFNVLAPRWDVIGGDIYGTSPGMLALGDGLQLHHEQTRKGQVIDYQTNPPLQIPTTFKNRDIDTLPGGRSYVDMTSAQAQIKPAFDVNLRLDYLLADIQDVRQRINSTFFVDIFLMLNNMNDTQKTATEIAELHEEKLVMLGPVTERLMDELLTPKVEYTFDRMLEAGILPPPPPELQGAAINIEFVSVLAQAQQAIGLNSLDRFTANLGVIAQIKPEVLDRFNPDEWAEIYADNLGVDPKILVPGEVAAMVRQQRAQAQQAAMQQQQANQAADSMAKLGSVQTGADTNAAQDVLNLFSGYNSPSPLDAAVQ